MYKLRWLKHIMLAGLLLLPVVTSGETQEDYEVRLQEIRERIATVLSGLDENRSKRDSVRDELKKLEITIARTAKSLRITQRKHTKSVKKLKNTKKALKELNRSLTKQRDILADQLRSAYAMGQQPHLKMILNQQDPAEMGRAMLYYNYLNQARSAEIKQFLSSIEQQKALQREVEDTSRELAELVERKASEKRKLTRNRNNRKQLLARINTDIEQQQVALQDLESSRTRIESLLESLGELLADIPAEPHAQKPFGDLKGQLPWPVKGKFRARYGTARQQGDLTWQGVVIDADYDTPVRAVSHGRVAFADWLQGYGFITIIDHNDGFMSLYGYTQELYKSVGDWVESSEVIATVGDSGGQQTSGLYFEIRKQGKPVNPKLWCSSQVQHLALQDN